MKKISVGKNQYALVDSNLYDYLSQWRWYYSGGYAYRYVKKAEREEKYKNYTNCYMKMEKEVMGCEKDMMVDHINRNKLDNRKSNLRFCTVSQNMSNRTMLANNRSGYKGVCRRMKKTKNGIVLYGWEASIRKDYKLMVIGRCYKSAYEAAHAYNEEAKKYFGEYAILNKI